MVYSSYPRISIFKTQESALNNAYTFPLTKNAWPFKQNIKWMYSQYSHSYHSLFFQLPLLIIMTNIISIKS